MTDSPSADDTIRRPLPAATSGTQHAGLPGAWRDGTEHQSESENGFESLVLPGLGPADGKFGANDDFRFSAVSSELPYQQLDSTIERAFDQAAINPLVGAAAPLLWLAGRLNESPPPENIEQFRGRILQELKRFETAAMARDIPLRLVRMSRYALAATVDDIILNTDWGGHTAWANHSLVSQIYNETWGGERFYDLLSQMRLKPEDNIDGLEFMAICLSVGFTGKYRVMEGGREQLSRLRYALYRTIREVRGPYDRDLSPAWAPVTAPHVAPKSARSAWLIAAVVAVLLAALWIASSISLHQHITAAADQINALKLNGAVTVAKPTPPDLSQLQLVHLRKLLAQDIAAGRVTVTRQNKQIDIRMPKLSFPSGGLAVAASEIPLLKRIGVALNGEQGPIRVAGYTDNIPVAVGSTLKNNTTVSRKRARSVANVLRQVVDDPSRITSEGYGAKDPIASNDTADGRRKNRRVVIRIDARQGR